QEIRRHYADHAVLVRTERVPQGVPGVRAVERFNHEWKLTLEPAASPESVLRSLLERGVGIESFALATLPLEDIFVKVVREGLGLDHGVSGPPTVDELPVVGAAARGNSLGTSPPPWPAGSS